MTDNDSKTDQSVQEAPVIDVEPEDQETQTPPSTDPAQQGGSGGWFVWLLVIVIVGAGGAYATWPYIGERYFGDKVNPVIADVKAALGLQTRPTAALPTTAPEQVAEPVQEPVTARPESVGAPQIPEAAEPQPITPPAPPQAAYPPLVDDEVLPPAPVAVAAAFDDRAQQFETRLRALESQTEQPAAQNAPMVNSLAARLDVLESQLNASMNDDGRAALDATGQLARTLAEIKAELTVLNTRLNALENMPRGRVDPSASAQALVLAVTQLKSRALGVGAFDAELNALARVGGPNPVIVEGVARLQQYAGSGVPTVATLAAGFKDMATAVMQVRREHQAAGLWGEVSNTLSGLVSVRRTDPARIDDPVERALAVAEQALASDDLNTSVAALSALPTREAQAAQGWLGQAKARQEVLSALDVLYTHAVAALAATGAQ